MPESPNHRAGAGKGGPIRRQVIKGSTALGALAFLGPLAGRTRGQRCDGCDSTQRHYNDTRSPTTGSAGDCPCKAAWFKPSAMILYSTLAKGPKLPLQDQINSTRHFMREMNRLGITSVIDAGGGGQDYPDDYEVVQKLDENDQLTVRIAYNLFAQKAGSELSDYERWVAMAEPGAGSSMLRMNGAGENLTWSAADFENFLEPRPDLAPTMEKELEPIVELLAEKEWPFRIHATYDESIDRFLTVFERVNGKTSFKTRFIIDHAETVSDRNLERIKALGGGVATQHRMAFQGEYFVDRYGADAAKTTPPIAKMLVMDQPVGAGTDATRVASYDPWTALYWLTTGKTLGGLSIYDKDNRLDRATALRLWTSGSAWFSGDEGVKGSLQRQCGEFFGRCGGTAVVESACTSAQ